MFDLTEESLREAASWQAFKRGRELMQSGAVSQVKSSSSGWQGLVKSGKRPMRVRVVVKSPTDLTVHCSCPENRSTGAVCACAVATGLVAIQGGKTMGTPEVAAEKTEEVVGPSNVAWSIRFPASWKKALAAGRLSARLQPGEKQPISSADTRLCEWLRVAGLEFNKSHTLALQGDQLGNFLICLEGHQGVMVDGVESSLVIEIGGRIGIASLERDGDGMRFFFDGNPDWRAFGESFWQISDNRMVMLGTEALVDGHRQAVERLMGKGQYRMAVRDFLQEETVWRNFFGFPDGSFLEDLTVRPVPHEIQMSLDGSASQLRATVSVCYRGLNPWPLGAEGLTELPLLEGNLCWQRDQGGEAHAISTLAASGFVLSEPACSIWTLTGRDGVVAFLNDSLPVLRERWKVLESSTISRLAASSAFVSPEIQIQGAGDDWLTFSVDYRTDDGEVLDRREVRRLLQGAHITTKRGKTCRIRGATVQACQSLLADLDVDQENGIYHADARSGLVIQEIANARSGSIDCERISDSMPMTFRGELRPYQQHGVAWLSDRTSRFGGAILADDMGLGKTVQTIAWAEAVFSRKPEGIILILATTSLLGNWASEWRQFATGRQTHILHGAKREAIRDRLGVGEVWITSHGTVVRDLAWYLRQDFLAVVVDEASLLRNPDTDQAKAVRKLKATCKVALTGTPIENSVTDLWALFSWVQPDWLGARSWFREQFEKPSRSEGAEREVALQHLRMKTSPFILRRTKDAVAPELPSKVVIEEFCDLLPEQAKLYAQFAREGRKAVDSALADGVGGKARMTVLTTLLRLRQICCNPSIVASEILKQKIESKKSTKLNRLNELLQEAVEGGHKVLVFSQFRKQLLEIEKSIKLNHWSSLRLDGQTVNRAKLVEEFQSESGPPIFLISLKAGGYGLNLTAADIVIHMDPWWNPAAEDQATDRAHRIGQLRPVTVYRLLTRGTAEEAVMRLQEKKRALVGAIDENGQGDAKGWTMEDLRGLM